MSQQYNPNSYETTPEEYLAQLLQDIQQLPTGEVRTELLRELQQLEELLLEKSLLEEKLRDIQGK